MSTKLRPMTPKEKKELARELAETNEELEYQREIAKQKLGINNENNNNNDENSTPNLNQNQSINYFNSIRNTAVAAVKSNVSSALRKMMDKKNNNDNDNDNDKKNLINTNQKLINSINNTVQRLKGIEKQQNKLTIDEQLELNKILKEVRGELDRLPNPKATRGGKTKKGKKNKTKKRK